jgi:hypothetical protein
VSPDSFIRSAARATSSAHRRIPIRWRLAGGSALLTLVILCGFAIAVGALTSQRIHDEFEQDVKDAADKLRDDVDIRPIAPGANVFKIQFRPNLNTFVSAEEAAARLLVEENGRVLRETENARNLGPPIDRSTRRGSRRPSTACGCSSSGA